MFSDEAELFCRWLCSKAKLHHMEGMIGKFKRNQEEQILLNYFSLKILPETLLSSIVIIARN